MSQGMITFIDGDEPEWDTIPGLIDNSVPESEKCALFGPDGYVGSIENIYGFYRARLKIKQEEAQGYYIEYNGVRYEITQDGRLPDWPDGFGDFVENILSQI